MLLCDTTTSPPPQLPSILVTPLGLTHPFPYTATTNNSKNAHTRIPPLPRQKAQSPANFRRRRLLRYRSLEGGTRCDHTRAMGKKHDGEADTGGAGQMLLQERGQSFGEVWGSERYVWVIHERNLEGVELEKNMRMQWGFELMDRQNDTSRR